MAGNRKKYWTEEQMQQIEDLAARGCTYSQICSLLHIARERLDKSMKLDASFRARLEYGKARGISECEGILFTSAKLGNMKAIMIYLQVMGVIGTNNNQNEAVDNRLSVTTKDSKKITNLNA